eukprot:5272280-Lingulodinium_polyedra.AAC.1
MVLEGPRLDAACKDAEFRRVVADTEIGLGCVNNRKCGETRRGLHGTRARRGCHRTARRAR